MNSVPEPVQDLIGKKYINLATYRKNGLEVQTPIWFIVVDGIIYVFTKSDAWKIKRIRNNSTVKIALCTISGTVTGEWSEGRAEVDPAVLSSSALYHQFVTKYGWQMRIANVFSSLTGQIKNRVLIAITVDD
ncbi:MAG: PPOX class F420-dependent oxidoreductase [Candidatus Lindowbacteria bacterium]|nr:PPOX class F420-dependent oxidoreductase [Candidatus Lindowbacteria bacterium]